MTEPTTAREALIVEAIGDVARLIQDVEALSPALGETCRTLEQATTALREELARFEARMAAITEQAKAQTVKHLAARVDEASRHSIDQQSRAMADAARLAFGAEAGAAVQRLRAALQPLIEHQRRSLEQWLTHLVVAAVASAATLALALNVGPR